MRVRLEAVAALAGLLLATEGLLSLASLARAALTFDVGPSTGAYLVGFTPSEERPPTTFRWATSRASLALPLLAGGGPGTLRLRAARFLDEPARVHLYAWGRPVATFNAPPGGYRLYSFPLAAGPGALRLDLAGEDPELAVAVDWVRIEGLRWRIPLSVWQPRALVAGAFLVALLAGFSTAGAALAAALLALGLAAWAAGDPFAVAHVAARLALPALALSALVAWVVRLRPGGRWLVLVLLASHLLKGAALFHPSYFYNDVRNNLRYVLALRDGRGTLAERNLAAQVQVGVAYPRTVGGRKYAFPYAPVFFLPFGALAEDRIVEAMKQVAAAAAAAEVVLVFALAQLVGGARAGVGAALVAALLPPLYNRLLLAMWSTVVGHLLDLATIVAVAWLAGRPESRRRWAAAGGSTLAAFLTYISSLFNLTLFHGFTVLLQRRLAARLLLAWAAAVAITVGWLYAAFVAMLFREILPGLLAGGASSGPAGDEAGGVGAALARIPIFYGWGYPALALAGFVLLRRGTPPALFRVVTAYALAFVSLVALRAFSGGLFKDLKEVEFVAPLVALTAGASLEELAARGRGGLVAAALLVAGLVAFSAARYLEYLRTYASLAGLGP